MCRGILLMILNINKRIAVLNYLVISNYLNIGMNITERSSAIIVEEWTNRPFIGSKQRLSRNVGQILERADKNIT